MTDPGPIPELLTVEQIARLDADDLAQLRARVAHPFICWSEHDRRVMDRLLLEVEALRGYLEAAADDLQEDGRHATARY